MFGKKGPNPKKAAKLEKKGDQYLAKGKFQKAHDCFRKSESLDPTRPGIYEKLHQSFQEIDREWTQEDFEISMEWTMRQQELEHPEIKGVLERFSPEYQAVEQLIQSLMSTFDPETEEETIEKIISYGDAAHRPLIDFLLALKKMSASESVPPTEQP